MLDFQPTIRGRSLDNQAHAKAIVNIINQDTAEFIRKFSETQLERIERDAGIASVRGTARMVAQMTRAYTLTETKFIRSFEIAQGAFFEQLIRDMGELSFTVARRITTLPLTDEQGALIENHISQSLRGWVPQISDYEKMGLDFSLRWMRPDGTPDSDAILFRNRTKEEVVDSYFLEERADAHHLIEVKTNLGTISATQARAERSKSLHQYFGLRNYLLQESQPTILHPTPSRVGMATPKVDFHLMGVEPDQPSSALRKLFLPQELAPGGLGLQFVTQLEDGPELFYQTLEGWKREFVAMHNRIIQAIYPLEGQLAEDELDEYEGIGL